MGHESISVEVRRDLGEALEREAQLSKVSASDVASEAIEHLLEYRRRKRQMLTAAAAELDKGVFISGETMHAWIDSWDTDSELPPPEPDIFFPPRK